MQFPDGAKMNLFQEALLYSMIVAATATPLLPADTAEKSCVSGIFEANEGNPRIRCALPVDDGASNQPVEWSPWTHFPGCKRAVNNPQTKYCVYSNSRHGHKGVSIITTPETAANNVEMLTDGGPSETRLGLNGTTKMAYQTIDVASKGKGVVAMRPIPRREEIMTDWASIVVSLDFPTSVRRETGYELLHRAADQLSDPDRILDLGTSSTTSADIIEDILRTNAFSLSLAGEPHMALYPSVSRINHACKPNAFIRFDKSSLAVGVVAARDIDEGEEISISYIPVDQTRPQRQAALRRWGFECQCSLCSASKAEVAASDYRRTKMQTLRGELMDLIDKRDGTGAVRLTKQMIELLRAEDLPSLLAAQYEILARLYWQARDMQTAKQYAKTSLDVLEDQGYLARGAGDLSALLDSFGG
ncbi:hypothetical protein F4780DRAFT_49156 [Xylariomycetidae sp. FL0641]|nr:hypothetical protein F4780DRAFT_49156 [Xylariomycetidae sp. FL0641]